MVLCELSTWAQLHSEGPALLAAAERQQLLLATDVANGEPAAWILALKFSDISFVGQFQGMIAQCMR